MNKQEMLYYLDMQIKLWENNRKGGLLRKQELNYTRDFIRENCDDNGR